MHVKRESGVRTTGRDDAAPRTDGRRHLVTLANGPSLEEINGTGGILLFDSFLNYENFAVLSIKAISAEWLR